MSFHHVKEFLARLKENNNPFVPVVEALLANTNSQEYAEINIAALLEAIKADRIKMIKF